MSRAAFHGCSPRSGQTMIFLVVVIVILAVVAAWVFDVHSILYLKTRTQNAGDAAALAAARWQGVSLNLIGDLNILQAAALSGGDTNAAGRMAAVQARLCFAGPLIGLLAAQQAAKHNRMYIHPDYTAELHDHAQRVGTYYASDTNCFVEPYPGAWLDYSTMLSNLADEGVSAGPDNTRYYNEPGPSHWLMQRGFYEAVAGQDWCWFYWYGLQVLYTYTDYQFWPGLPQSPASPDTANCEIFSLSVAPVTATLPGGTATVPPLESLRAARRLGAAPVSDAAAGCTSTWYCYRWTAWTALAPSQRFPIEPLRVKPPYDYTGADAVVRVEAEQTPRLSTPHTRLQPFLARSSTAAGRLGFEVRPGPAIWTAAAKPFGALETGGQPARPDAYALVLPAFRQVRLIPVDSATGSDASAYDIAWRVHRMEHLPLYMQDGLAGLQAGCWYCQQLQTWEQPDFRQLGMDWLSDTNHVCVHYGGPGGPGGGTRRGH